MESALFYLIFVALYAVLNILLNYCISKAMFFFFFV